MNARHYVHTGASYPRGQCVVFSRVDLEMRETLRWTILTGTSFQFFNTVSRITLRELLEQSHRDVISIPTVAAPRGAPRTDQLHKKMTHAMHNEGVMGTSD